MLTSSSLPHGPFTAADASAAGINRYRLQQLTRERRVRHVFYGVYLDAGVADTIGARVDCLGLVLPPFAVACDRTAAWLHGIDTFEYRELEILPPLDVCCLPTFTRMRRPGVRGKVRDLEPSDVNELSERVRVTTPVRTALDLGCLLPRWSALAALDSYLRTYELDPFALLRASKRYRGRRGVRQLRDLMSLADPRSESPGESLMRIALLDSGLPTPVLQYKIIIDGRELYRLDLAYPKSRVCVEYDGREYHSTPEQRAADKSRRQWLRDHGWTVIVVTKDDLDKESARRWTGEVGRALKIAW